MHLLTYSIYVSRMNITISRHYFPVQNSANVLFNISVLHTRENQQMYQLLFDLIVVYGGSYMFRHCTRIAILSRHF
jgi:hypothetical protein